MLLGNRSSGLLLIFFPSHGTVDLKTLFPSTFITVLPIQPIYMAMLGARHSFQNFSQSHGPKDLNPVLLLSFPFR